MHKSCNYFVQACHEWKWQDRKRVKNRRESFRDCNYSEHALPRTIPPAFAEKMSQESPIVLSAFYYAASGSVNPLKGQQTSPDSDPSAPATHAATSSSSKFEHRFYHQISSSLPTHNATRDISDMKSMYLREMRTTLTVLQGEINMFLTGRMELENAAAGAEAEQAAKKEEEIYGEENVEG